MVDEQRDHGEDKGTHNGEGDDTPSVQLSSTEQKDEGPLRLWQKLNNHRGILCILLCAFAYALENVLFRAVENDMHSTEVLFSTHLVKVLFLLPVITYKGHSLRPASKVTYIFLIGRGVISMIAMNAMYFALPYINVGDATAIALSSPVFIGIFAKIFLKEAFGIIDALLTLVVVVGVFLISKPSFIFGGSEEETISNLVGVAFASFSCICNALANVLNRHLGLLHINSFVNVLFYVTVNFLGSGILTSIFGVWSVPACGYARIILVTMGIVGCTGNCLKAYAYSLEKSVFLGIFQTNEIIFAYLLEFLLFNAIPDLIALLGVCLVVLASLMTLIKKRKEN